MRPTAPRRRLLVAEQSGWREYFYPETLEHADGVVQGTLRNLLGERDDERLAAAEYPLARYRAHQLRLDPALVTPPPDPPGPHPGRLASRRATRPRRTSHRPGPDPVGRVPLVLVIESCHARPGPVRARHHRARPPPPEAGIRPAPTTWHTQGAFSGTSSRNTQCPCRGGLGAREEVGAVSKSRGRSRRGKGTARKVSEILNSIARLVRAVSVLVDALGRWLS